MNVGLKRLATVRHCGQTPAFVQANDLRVVCPTACKTMFVTVHRHFKAGVSRVHQVINNGERLG